MSAPMSHALTHSISGAVSRIWRQVAVIAVLLGGISGLAAATLQPDPIQEARAIIVVSNLEIPIDQVAITSTALFEGGSVGSEVAQRLDLGDGQSAVGNAIRLEGVETTSVLYVVGAADTSDDAIERANVAAEVFLDQVGELDAVGTFVLAEPATLETTGPTIPLSPLVAAALGGAIAAAIALTILLLRAAPLDTIDSSHELGAIVASGNTGSIWLGGDDAVFDPDFLSGLSKTGKPWRLLPVDDVDPAIRTQIFSALNTHENTNGNGEGPSAENPSKEMTGFESCVLLLVRQGSQRWVVDEVTRSIGEPVDAAALLIERVPR